MSSEARRELAAGVVLLALAAAPTQSASPPLWELRWFSAVNDLPDRLYRPIWVVMQLGALGAVPAAAVAAVAAGDRQLGGRIVRSGAAAWVGAKVLKRVVRRARPGVYLSTTRIRGAEAWGGGFPSGHAGVATAMAAATLASARPAARPVLAGVAATVAAARMYVGAHLPLDVVGGVALGLCVDGVVGLWRSPEAGVKHRFWA